MIALTKHHIKGLLAGVFLACAFSQGAAATEVSGIKFDDSIKVAGKDLKLNGAGVRTKFVIKLYAAGLYLTDKKTTVPEVLKSDGPRRMTLVMMREISSDAFGSAFMAGLNDNVDKAEKSKIVSQISKFGEMFASIDGLKKGDVLHLDWTPGSGTQCELNGKKVGELLPDLAFYNALLSIWLGEKPVDSSLKPALLGAAK
jgi:hypothetical protein